MKREPTESGDETVKREPEKADPVQRLVMACPFCGSGNPDIVHVTGSTTGWAVSCYICGGQGPAIQGDMMTARQKAVEMWNRRQEDKREVKVLAPLSGCKEMNCPDYKDNMCQHNSPWCRYNTPVEGPMPIKLAFHDWQNRKGESVYQTPDGIDLSIGNFHSGSTFDGIIDIDEDDQGRLINALDAGYVPVFIVFKP